MHAHFFMIARKKELRKTVDHLKANKTCDTFFLERQYYSSSTNIGHKIPTHKTIILFSSISSLSIILIIYCRISTKLWKKKFQLFFWYVPFFQTFATQVTNKLYNKIQHIPIIIIIACWDFGTRTCLFLKSHFFAKKIFNFYYSSSWFPAT